MEALGFAVCSSSLKTRFDLILKATGRVLSRCETTFFLFGISTRMETGGHGLTYRVEVWLASIKPIK